MIFCQIQQDFCHFLQDFARNCQVIAGFCKILFETARKPVKKGEKAPFFTLKKLARFLHKGFPEAYMHTNIETIPLLVSEGKMTRKEAANLIWEDIYLYPGKYGLPLKGDKKSEYLIYLRQRLEGIFDDYDAEKTRFRTYVWGLVKNTCKSWFRLEKNHKIHETTAHKHYCEMYEAAQYEYDNIEDTLCAEPEINIRDGWKRKERQIAEKAALILALKSCYDIDEQLIESVSRFTGIRKEKIFEKIEKMKEKSEHKLSRRDEAIRRRDNAFYYHRKYCIELNKLRKGTSSFESVEKKYRLQTERWVRQNRMLSHRFVLAPSNAEIAKELGMKARQVCFYIEHLRKRRPNIYRQSQDENKNEVETIDEKAEQ